MAAALETLAAFTPSPAPFVALLVLGFLVGAAGHLVQSNLMIAIGIGLIFVTVVLMPLVLFGNPF